MPKVSEEYIINKKKRIIDAAYALCLKKTVSTVTMQDIIDETGLSQGGIYRFYKDKMICLDVKPNVTHLKLAELEAAGKLKAVITQNIDGLHQKAGSKNVLELHGSIHRNYCVECGKFYDARYIKEAEGIPRCDCGGIVKPDVVLYEEGLDNTTIQKSIRAIQEADMLIIGGTSLVVYPAAGFIDYFRGKYLVVINKSETSRDGQANLCIQEPIGEVLGSVVVRR